jgi:pyruvate formate lyase activating enzyme
MQIGGFQKLSLIDYPGKVAAVVFTQGCNFRCPYCHNPELVIPECFREPIPENGVLRFLEKRSDQLEGVVISGGEPTQQKDLFSFIANVKRWGYLVKLDTNGSHPDILDALIRQGMIDFIAMDIKAPIEKYEILTGIKCCTDSIKKSINLIKDSGIKYQFRTTLVKPLLSEADFSKLSALAEGEGAYVFQRFVPHENILDKSLLDRDAYTKEDIIRFQKMREKSRE